MVGELTQHVAVTVEVTSVEEAQKAVQWGATSLVLHEAAGETSDYQPFSSSGLGRSSGCHLSRGGIGPDTAAAAVWGGATGVVLDNEIGLFPECCLPMGTNFESF